VVLALAVRGEKLRIRPALLFTPDSGGEVITMGRSEARSKQVSKSNELSQRKERSVEETQGAKTTTTTSPTTYLDAMMDRQVVQTIQVRSGMKTCE
jgi:hypothetical protein